jgi:hypothetical protein
MSTQQAVGDTGNTDESFVSGDAYIDFIQQLQLERIWLKSTRVTNSAGGDVPQGASVHISDTPTWKDAENGFQAFHKYVADFRNEKNRKLAKVEIEFGLDYGSEEPMTDEIFEIFAVNNLPLNSWPYFREYLASTVGRMGWIPFTLPARKILGAPVPDDEVTPTD